jgi:hypothetical protein
LAIFIGCFVWIGLSGEVKAACHLVAMEQWSVIHRMFVVGMFFKSKSVVKTQHIFRQRFWIVIRGAVPSCTIILHCVQRFQETGSVKSNIPGDKQQTVCMKMAVFWVVAPCSLVQIYQRFRGPCCLHRHSSPWGWRQQRPLKRW